MASSGVAVQRPAQPALRYHADELRIIADGAAGAGPSILRERLRAEQMFLAREWLPHLAALERTLFPALAWTLQRRDALEPMRREYADVERLTRALDDLATTPDEGCDAGWVLGLRRTLYQLSALLVVCLSEEELYLPIVSREGGPKP